MPSLTHTTLLNVMGIHAIDICLHTTLHGPYIRKDKIGNLRRGMEKLEAIFFKKKRKKRKQTEPNNNDGSDHFYSPQRG
jgi:hypothetical protein